MTVRDGLDTIYGLLQNVALWFVTICSRFACICCKVQYVNCGDTVLIFGM